MESPVHIPASWRKEGRLPGWEPSSGWTSGDGGGKALLAKGLVLFQSLFSPRKELCWKEILLLEWKWCRVTDELKIQQVLSLGKCKEMLPYVDHSSTQNTGSSPGPRMSASLASSRTPGPAIAHHWMQPHTKVSALRAYATPRLHQASQWPKTWGWALAHR